MPTMDQTSRDVLDLMQWCSRAGAAPVEFGFMEEHPDPKLAHWWAKAQIGPGEFVIADKDDTGEWYVGPVEAMTALKTKIIDLCGGDDLGAEQ